MRNFDQHSLEPTSFHFRIFHVSELLVMESTFVGRAIQCAVHIMIPIRLEEAPLDGTRRLRARLLATIQVTCQYREQFGSSQFTSINCEA